MFFFSPALLDVGQKKFSQILTEISLDLDSIACVSAPTKTRTEPALLKFVGKVGSGGAWLCVVGGGRLR